jgi:hypothetical protein
VNIATNLFDENRRAGLMICGINWGSDPDAPQSEEKASFFSDRSVNDEEYRDRLVKWFALWGHPLESTSEKAGPFERSIVQTNWWPDQSRTIETKSVYDECVREWGNFERDLAELQPAVILFLSVELMHALNSPACAAAAQRILGSASPPRVLTHDVQRDGRALKRFRVGFQNFERAEVVALPHPTGSVGLFDEYIASFTDEIAPVIARYKAHRGFAV